MPSAGARNGEDAKFRILAEVSRQISSILDIDQLLEHVVRLIQETFQYYHVGIGLVEGDQIVYRVGAGELWDDPGFRFKPSRLKIGVEGLTGWVAKEGKPALVPDVSVDPRYVWMQSSRTRSELVVPIIVRDLTIGVLDVQSEHPDTFSEADLELVQALANQTGVAIENARFFDQLRERTEEVTEALAQQTALSEVLQVMARSPTDLQPTLRAVAEKAARLCDSYDAEIGLVEGDVFKAAAQWGPVPLPRESFDPGIPISRQSATGRAILEKRAIHVEDILAEPDAEYSISRAHNRRTGQRTLLAAPLVLEGQAIGYIFLPRREVNPFSAKQIALLKVFADQAAIAVQNVRLSTETQRLLKETEQRARELTIINSVQQGLGAQLDLQGVCELVGEEIRRVFAANTVVVATFDLERDLILRHYVHERGQRLQVEPRPIGIWRPFVERGRSLLANSGLHEANRRFDPAYRPDIGEEPKSMLSVPLIIQDKVQGVISLQDVEHENAFTESDQRLLETLAGSMSVAIQRARLYERTRHMAVMEERQRLARELHDSVTQSLYGVSLYAEAAGGQFAKGNYEKAGEYLQDIRSTALDSLADMRLLIHELRPPLLEKEGLVAILQSRLYGVENRAGIKTELQSNLTERLPLAAEEDLYRIATEALNNALKHARPGHVYVRLLQDEAGICLEVADDGLGFVPEEVSGGGLGLATMKERARSHGWELTVDSQPGAGTRVRTRWEVKA
ncbi:MAG TPA: GAF domain-containing sensor histidine kinase [Anaerolineales bacterium]|nr:GAF domain-containing sensor histidine kinase [Anaerolineales bacterium]